MALKKEFVDMLDEGRGRPKKVTVRKDVDDDDGDVDDSGKEGVRTVTLTAKIKIGKKTESDEKVLKDMNTKDLDKEIDKYEKALHKKYKYDADSITITKKIGKYEVDDKAENQTKDDAGEGSEHDGYSLGRKSDEK
jgi:hypothetical protein